MAIILTLKPDHPYRQLCEEYWAMDGRGQFVHLTADLAKRHGVKDSELAAMVRDAGEARLDDVVCQRCHAAQRVVQSRSDYRTARGQIKHWPWTCEACQQAEQAERETDRPAAPEPPQNTPDQRAIIQKRYGADRRQPVDPRALSLANAVYLLTLLRYCSTEDMQSAGLSVQEAADAQEMPMAPSVRLTIEMLDSLWDTGLMRVHPDSPADAFEFEGESIPSIYPYHIRPWLPYGLRSTAPRDLLADLESLLRSDDWPEAWAEQRLELWRNLARHEVLGYLLYLMDEHRLDFTPGDKTMTTIDGLLDSYPVSQIWHFCWSGVTNAVAYQRRERVSIKQAANSVIGYLQRAGDRARAEGWDISSYHRPWERPISALSRVVFETALRLGSRGIDTVVSQTELDRTPRDESE